MSKTARYLSCQVCHVGGNLPHAAHQRIECVSCGKDLGMGACEPENVERVWWGICKHHSDPYGTLGREIERHNAGLELADQEARRARALKADIPSPCTGESVAGAAGGAIGPVGDA